MLKKIYIAIFSAFLALPLLAQTENNRGYIVKIGDQAPDFELQTTDGKSQKLSSLRGKVVMLQFTASWCKVCRREMPFIEKDIWQKHKNNPNFALFGIDLKEDSQTIADFVKATGVTYPMAFDTFGTLFELYAAADAGVTRNVIVDQNGKIVFLTRLFSQEEFTEMCQKIEELLKNQK